MISKRAIMIGVAGLALCGLGVGGVIAGGLQDGPPQDARPADPIGDILKNTPVEGEPVGQPAPANATPVAVPTPRPYIDESGAPIVLEVPAPVVVAEEKAKAEVKPDTPDVPAPRQRRRVAIVEAIDKVTAERMRFEVVVGGRPVRFNGSLIFSARACEVTAPDEPVSDAIAYLDVTIAPKGTAVAGAPREIFRGWMFASTPALSGLQHPAYDAWVVGCKA